MASLSNLRHELKRAVQTYLAAHAPNASISDAEIEAVIDSSLKKFHSDLQEALASGRVMRDPRSMPAPSDPEAFTKDERQGGPL